MAITGLGQGGLVMLAGLILVNLALWGLALLLFGHSPVLLGTAFLAYGFGLRHAVDADHIAAIDNVTRKLMRPERRPVGVGLWFSLGHSSVVFVLAAAVAASAGAVQAQFGALAHFGGVAGTLVSAGFLFGLAAMNLLVLISVIATFRQVKAGGSYREDELDLLLARRGIFSRVFRALFGLVRRDWHMYLIGALFGLGFDTATEIGLLGISATGASHGLPVWTILLFPGLFAAGMALVDMADTLLMLGAYGWAFAQPARKLYYNITITSVSALVAVIIGGVEALGLVQETYKLSGAFWAQVAALNNNFGTLGYVIIGIFVLSWLISIAVYKAMGYDRIGAEAGY